jgi:hypothetical protein
MPENNQTDPTPEDVNYPTTLRITIASGDDAFDEALDAANAAEAGERTGATRRTPQDGDTPSITADPGPETSDEFFDLLEKLLDAGSYLDEAVYLEAIRKARPLAADLE